MIDGLGSVESQGPQRRKSFVQFLKRESLWIVGFLILYAFSTGWSAASASAIGAGCGSSTRPSSDFFSASGVATFFLLVLVFLIVGTTVTATLAPARRLSSSVDSVDGLMRPLVALVAISPSFVRGVYAPPANLYPHFLQCQTPTLHLLTVLNIHLGHSCFVRRPVTIAMYRRRVTVPYRAPNPPAKPVLRVISLSPRPVSWPGSLLPLQPPGGPLVSIHPG